MSLPLKFAELQICRNLAVVPKFDNSVETRNIGDVMQRCKALAT
jgi:hypothetical protein